MPGGHAAVIVGIAEREYGGLTGARADAAIGAGNAQPERACARLYCGIDLANLVERLLRRMKPRIFGMRGGAITSLQISLICQLPVGCDRVGFAMSDFGARLTI